MTTADEITNERGSSNGDPLSNRPRSKILVDGGDPEETLRVKQALGFVDGQTTNPSLIAKNPAVKKLVASGHALSEEEEGAEYRKIVQAISPLVGSAGVSIEVFADLDTSADQMLSQGRHMFTWIPNAYIKYPCTPEGLKEAERLVAEGIRVNITLCFSQDRAAAVYAAQEDRDRRFTFRRLLGGSMTLARMGWICCRTSSGCTPRVTVTSLFLPQVFVTCSNSCVAFN